MKENYRIFVTGDIHGSNSIIKLSKKNWKEGQTLSKKDVVIILGDFGLLWNYYRTKEEDYWLKWLNAQPWTTLIVDGNHENYDLLENLQKKHMFGSEVGIISYSIFHLLRSEVYIINGKKCLVIGGAQSHDRQYRKWGKSMWHQEEITDTDIIRAKMNLEKVDYNVDLVLTHCAPIDFAMKCVHYENAYFRPDSSEENLSILKDHSALNFDKWLFGHYHLDLVDPYEDKWECVYHKIKEIV